MAQPIYTQLINGRGDIDHNGDTLKDVDMPEWLKELGQVYAKRLPLRKEIGGIFRVLWKYNMVSEFLGLAAQQAVVGWRAYTRPADLPHPTLKGDKIKQSIIILEDVCRERGLEYAPKGLPRPKVALTQEQIQAEAVKTLQAAGLSIEQITAMASK